MVKSLAKSRSIACICGSLRTQLWMHRSGSIDHTSKTIPAFRPIVGARVSLASDYGRGRLLSTSGRCASASEVPIANKIEDTTENAEKLNTKPKRIKMIKKKPRPIGVNTSQKVGCLRVGIEGRINKQYS